MARFGTVWLAGQGTARRGVAGGGMAGMARRVAARLGEVRQGAAGVENAERRKMKWCISTKCLTQE